MPHRVSESVPRGNRPALTSEEYVRLRDAISEHIEKAARETGTYHGDPTATPGGTGYCLPAAVATQIVDKYLLDEVGVAGLTEEGT